MEYITMYYALQISEGFCPLCLLTVSKKIIFVSGNTGIDAMS